MRIDAQKNRELLIEAAYDLFGERGNRVPLHAIAWRAGVGSATLHRHFASRCDLIEAVLGAKGGDFLSKVDTPLSEGDSLLALCRFVNLMVDPDGSDRAFKGIFIHD